MNQLGGLEEHVLRDGEPQGLVRLEVNHEVALAGLLDGQVGGAGASLSGREEVAYFDTASIPSQTPAVREVIGRLLLG